jgi:uncharacterized protein
MHRSILAPAPISLLTREVPMNLPADVQALLRNTHTIALVGASDDPTRASARIGRYLLANGYAVTPVTPQHTTVYDQPAVATLAAMPQPPDLVLCFRRADAMLAIARDAVHRGARALWMQSGIINEEAADLALAAGLTVVMDRCIQVDHRTWMAEGVR